MCLAVSMWYYIFQCIWDSLAGLDAPLQSTNTVFGIFLLTDNKINSPVLARSTLHSSPKLLNGRNVARHLCPADGIFRLASQP